MWATDAEVMAASAILDADIYVANDDYINERTLSREVRWNLLRASNNPSVSIYITNYASHYQPVTSMVNSPTPTYGNASDHAHTIE